MPILGYKHGLLQGLSDFWQRFFADSDQLEALYHGQAVLMGQTYLDMLANVLSVSLKDTPTFNKEYYKLVLIGENQTRLDLGATTPEDRWVYTLPEGLVGFASLDNRVIEPTASLQESLDYSLEVSEIRLKTDVTDPLHDGIPTLTYARRSVDVAVGGKFDDTARLVPTPGSWIAQPNATPAVVAWTGLTTVYKGDTLRLLGIGPGVTPPQKKKSDHTIVLVRADGLYVDTATPLTAPETSVDYVILRQPAVPDVSLEPMTFTLPSTATTIDVLSNGAVLPQAIINVASTAGFPTAGTLLIATSLGAQQVTYTGVTATTFTGCAGGTGTLATGGSVTSVLSYRTTIGVLSNGAALPQAVINVASTVGFPASGTLAIATSLGYQQVTYTGVTATTFTGCAGGTGTLATGGDVASTLNLTGVANLVHTRLDEGSVRILAKRFDGQDVVEGVDYTVDYETGVVYKRVDLATNPGSVDWSVASLNLVSYTWRLEIYPNIGGLPPRFSTTGKIVSAATTTRVQQLALWAPDAFVDRRILSNNFGSLVGFEEASSENYRAFLRGVFQLYVLGPVLERVESALNVVLGYPVIRDDGEVLVTSVTTVTEVIVTTTRATYVYPASTPMRLDVLAPVNFGVLSFVAFESLTTAITVTDYIETPNWWHFAHIPLELFSETAELAIPSVSRRTVSPELVENLIGAVDAPEIGDPDLYIGANEEALIPPSNNTTIAIASNGQVLPQAIINVVSTTGFPATGTFTITTSIGDQTVAYTGTTPTSFTGCTGGLGTLSTGGAVTAPHAIFRHRMAFVLMDRFLKYHTFVVKFDPAVLTDEGAQGRYIRSIDDLNRLIYGAKPAHTYVFVAPTTAFRDVATIADADYYQPQRYIGADPNAPEIYLDPSFFPAPLPPFVQLGLFVGLTIQSPPGGDDKVLFADDSVVINTTPWNIGDYFHYEQATTATGFPVVAVAVTLTGAPAPPRKGQLVRVYVGTTIGGKALVENIDYTVDPVLRTVTRLTVWDSIVAVPVTYVQANIGNVADAPADPTIADMTLLLGNNDPATIRAAYDPLAVDWMGNLLPVTDHRDISLVERALTIKVT